MDEHEARQDATLRELVGAYRAEQAEIEHLARAVARLADRVSWPLLATLLILVGWLISLTYVMLRHLTHLPAPH